MKHDDRPNGAAGAARAGTAGNVPRGADDAPATAPAVSMRTARAQVVHTLTAEQPRTRDELHELLAGIGWSRHDVRLAIGDTIAAGDVIADIGGTLRATTPAPEPRA